MQPPPKPSSPTIRKFVRRSGQKPKQRNSKFTHLLVRLDIGIDLLYMTYNNPIYEYREVDYRIREMQYTAIIAKLWDIGNCSYSKKGVQ